jgi:hypothetical protein
MYRMYKQNKSLGSGGVGTTQDYAVEKRTEDVQAEKEGKDSC